MSVTPSLKTKKYTIPAGGTREVNMVGTLVCCLSTTGSAGDITMRIGNGASNRLDAGDKYRFNPSDRFDTFYLDNGSGADVTVSLSVGDGDVTISNAVNVTNTVTTQETKAATLGTTADVALTNGVATLIAAASATQREVHVSNLLANGTQIRIGDSNVGATRGAEVGIGETRILSTKAAVYAFVGAAGKSVGVMTVGD